MYDWQTPLALLHQSDDGIHRVVSEW